MIFFGLLASKPFLHVHHALLIDVIHEPEQLSHARHRLFN
jgi:hypothetical protein